MSAEAVPHAIRQHVLVDEAIRMLEALRFLPVIREGGMARLTQALMKLRAFRDFVPAEVPLFRGEPEVEEEPRYERGVRVDV